MQKVLPALVTVRYIWVAGQIRYRIHARRARNGTETLSTYEQVIGPVRLDHACATQRCSLRSIPGLSP